MTGGKAGGYPDSSGGTGTCDVPGAVTGVLVRYVRTLAGDAGVRRMLALSGEFRSGAMLESPDTFSSHEQMVTLLHAGAQVTGDGDIGLHVGEEMLRQYQGTDVEERFRSLGSPSAMAAQVADSVAHFTAFVTSQAVDVGETYAKVKVVTRPGVRRHLHFCEFTRGLLSQVPVPFGQPPAAVGEVECQARGGRFCLYELIWEKVPEPPQPLAFPWGGTPTPDPDGLQLDPETRIAQLASQLRQMEERLEGVFSTASELVGEEGIDTLLRRITSRAAQAVSASRYLLVVRTSPDADVQLHHHGFNPAEAQELASELWREHPDDDDGARLIVDIQSSRRRYGRLAAVYPPGVRYFESERRMLALYAGYAATALDVVTSLENARRSDATARALLGFSGALSRVTTTDDAAQLLADTVPTVIGCQHGTVMLWDPDRRQLTVRAVTGGTEGAGVGFERITTTDPATADGGPVPDTAGSGADRGPPLTVSAAAPVVERMIGNRALAVIDDATEDPSIRDLLLREGTTASVVAPLFAGDEFLGVVAANFTDEVLGSVIRGRDLHERLTGLADQAVTALQNVRLLEQISHSAWHDALTGLPNRRLLEDRVEQELVRGRRVGESACLFFVDLDRFKVVNDTMGHAAGDELIRQVGARLVDTVRRQDTVARLGGDEFAVLLPGLSDPGAIDQLALRCLAAVGAPFQVFGRDVRTSASIGVALAPEDGQSCEQLLGMADQAMYRSKALGRNTFTQYAAPTGPPGAPGHVGDLDLELALDLALERGELFVLYQPYVEVATTRMVGVEALVRWRHPTLGVLEPESFIPSAESSQIIVSLDTWVLEQACRQVRQWLDEGVPPIRLSVNVASLDLVDPGFHERVVNALETSGVEPGQLELQITERVVLDDEGVAEANIDGLRRVGVLFSFDAFGRGNADDDRFDTLNLTTMTIDRSIIQVLGGDRGDHDLVAAIRTVAEALGLECVTAEGGAARTRVLLQRGLTTAQGFFFSPPLLPGDVPRMLAEGPGPADPGGPTAS